MFWGPFRAFRRIGPFLRPYRGQILLVFALGGAASLLGLAQPYLSKQLIDRGLLGRNPTALAEAAVLMFVFTMGGFAFNFASSYLYVRISARMLFDMRLALFRHLHGLSPRFYANTKLGEIVSRLNNDLGEVQRVTADLPLSAVTQVVFFLGSLVLMLSLNPKLTAVSVALAPFGLLAYRGLQNRIGKRTRQVRDRGAGIGSFLIQSLMGQRFISASNGLGREEARFKHENDRFLVALMDLQRVSLLSGALPGAMTAASTALVFLYGGYLILGGELTLGGLVAFLSYHSRLVAPIQSLMSMSVSFTMARVSLDRVSELFDTKPDVTDPMDPAHLTSVRGEVSLDKVSMPETHLRDYSVLIPAGAFCAICGPSGSGKSTIADLLIRFLDPAEGKILLDGIDIRQLKLTDLRSMVVLVDQAPFLFHCSVRENLRMAHPEAAARELEAAAKAVGIEEILDRETAGERGMALSAGERQRIALAQCLLRKPRVVVLDEPTAALDAENEARIVSLLRDEWRGVTRIVLTHSEAVAAAADFCVQLGDK